jgi:hypothetical protein
MGLLAAAPIDNSDLRQSLNAIARPSEAPLFIRLRIENPRHLSRRRKEVPVNESVVVRKEHAKSRMGVIPADNPFLRILLILYGINVFPRILGEGDVGACLFSILALNTRRNLNTVIAILSNEHTADLGLTA